MQTVLYRPAYLWPMYWTLHRTAAKKYGKRMGTKSYPLSFANSGIEVLFSNLILQESYPERQFL